MYFVKLERFLSKLYFKRAAVKQNIVAIHPSKAIKEGPIRTFLRKVIFPYYFVYYRIPTERSSHAHHAQFCRHKGLMADDGRRCNNALLELAIDLLPLQLKQDREKRLAMTTWLLQSRLEWDPSQQNFDPTIPYLAPYIEEARFLLQEEEELLCYHQWHRRLYKSQTTGFGESDRKSKLSTFL